MLGDAYIKARERVKPKSKEERKRYEQTFDLSERVHEAEAEKNPPLKVGKGKEEQEIRPEHAFEVSIEAANFTKEKYELYAQYQKTVHNDTDCSEKGFKRFLCELPMKNSKVSYQTPEGETKEKLLGSYHQLYRLDGKLVAIAVLDLLPDAVSAVYFIYDESLHKWSPGKLSALREASLAVEAGYEWYMMGYYIHSCKKMRYKGDYGPQEILDPASLGWWPLDEEIKRKLDERKYVSVSEDRKAEQEGKEPPQPEPTPYDEDDPTPVWDRGMPGVLSKAEVEAYDLGAIALNVGGQDVECQDLVVWASSNLDRNDSIRCWIGELVAAVGTELADQMTVKFS